MTLNIYSQEWTQRYPAPCRSSKFKHCWMKCIMHLGNWVLIFFYTMHIVQCIVSLISTLLDLLSGFIYLLNLNICSVSISVFLLLMVFAPELTKWGTKSLDKVSSTHQLSLHVKALYLKTVCVYSIFHIYVNGLVCIFVLVTSGN